MTTPTYRPGWYPDPWRIAAHRWFDGSAWTAQTRDADGPAPAAPASAPPAAPPGVASAPTGPTFTPVPEPYGQPPYGAPQYGQAPYGQAPSGAPQYGAPQYGAPQYGAPQYGAPQYPPMPPGAPSNRELSPGGNTNAFIAVGLAALYVVIALAGNVVFFGILPVLTAVRSVRNREPLRWVAVAAAAVSVVVALTRLSS